MCEQAAVTKKGQRLLNIYIYISPLGSAAPRPSKGHSARDLAISTTTTVSMLTYRNRKPRTRLNPGSRALATSHPDFITCTKRRQSRVLASRFPCGQTGRNAAQSLQWRLVGFLFVRFGWFVVHCHQARDSVRREFMCCDVFLLSVRVCYV